MFCKKRPSYQYTEFTQDDCSIVLDTWESVLENTKEGFKVYDYTQWSNIYIEESSDIFTINIVCKEVRFPIQIKNKNKQSILRNFANSFNANKTALMQKLDEAYVKKNTEVKIDQYTDKQLKSIKLLHDLIKECRDEGCLIIFPSKYIPTLSDTTQLENILSSYRAAFQHAIRSNLQDHSFLACNVGALANTLLPIINKKNTQNSQINAIKNAGLLSATIEKEILETEYNLLIPIAKTEPLVLNHQKLKNKALYTPSAYLAKINEILQILETKYIKSLREDYLPRYKEVNQENAILQQLNALISNDSTQIIAAFNLEQSQFNYANYTFLLSDRLNQEKREDQDKESNSILKGDARARSVKNLLSAAAEARKQMLRSTPNLST